MKNKEEAAEFLGVSVRTLVRRTSEWGLVVTQKQVGRTLQSFYDEAQLEEVRQMLARGVKVAPLSPAEEPAGESLAVAGDCAQRLTQLVAAALAPAVRELRAAADAWPVWMTRAQALELSGLAPSWLAAGVRSGELSTAGTRHTRRFHRDELRAFAERVKDDKYLTRLLGKKE